MDASQEVALPPELLSQISSITAGQCGAFARHRLGAMFERSDMIRLADEVDVTRCDAMTFADVLRSAKSYADLDFMAVAAAVRQNI